MTRTGRGSLLAVFVAQVVAQVEPLSGQNSNDLNGGIQFDFSLPGARSLGMGGAFAALADDATSAYSNPAGLTTLTRPEISVEGRHWLFTSVIADRGHAFGPPSGIGIDSIEGLVDAKYFNEATGVSFLSFLYPRANWRIGAFLHELSRYRADRQQQGPFFDCSGAFREEASPRVPFCSQVAKEDGVDRIFPKKQSISLDIRSAGVASAYQFTKRLSLGLALVFYDFRIDALNRVFTARLDKKFTAVTFAEPDDLELTSTQKGDDNDFAVNVGLVWEVHDKWSIGASYRQGPEFSFRVETIIRPRIVGTGGPEPVFGPGVDRFAALETANPFKVPDTYAVGIVFRPSDPWRISLEYDRVQYSQLIEEFRDVSGQEPNEVAVMKERIRINDANQFRIGAEYAAALSRIQLMFRGGAWYEPEHRMHFEIDDPATGLPLPRWALNFPKGQDDVHVTAGFGLALSRHFQIDVGADFGDVVRTLSLSSIWRF